MYDERLAKIEEERQKALTNSNNKYSDLLKENESNYKVKSDLITQYETTQNDILDKQLKYYEDQINKQKESALKNKETEERKARNDYMNYINPYGYQNENLIQNGLLNSGVYTKENLGAYTTYQNRLSSANKVLQDAFVEYDNQMNEARMNNDVQKAQNALARLQQQINFADTFYSNKSNLTLNQLQNEQDLDDTYFNRYQTVYSNIQDEKKWQQEYNLSLAKLNGNTINTTNNTKNSTIDSSEVLSGVDYEGQKAANGITIIENPFTHNINEDTKYGVFESEDGKGYQPNNIGGVKLKKSGSINSEGNNIWIYEEPKDEKGNPKQCYLVVWDGKQNKYVIYNGTLSGNNAKKIYNLNQ